MVIANADPHPLVNLKLSGRTQRTSVMLQVENANVVVVPVAVLENHCAKVEVVKVSILINIDIH